MRGVLDRFGATEATQAQAKEFAENEARDLEALARTIAREHGWDPIHDRAKVFSEVARQRPGLVAEWKGGRNR